MKNFIPLLVIFFIFTFSPSSLAQTLQSFPDITFNGQFYELKNGQGLCADIPTNNGKISSERVIAWQCGNKDWQKWVMLSSNTFRNAFHSECIFGNNGLNCDTNHSGINQYPVLVSTNKGYQLKTPQGKCADIPTNGGKRTSSKVIAWNCGNKDWQKWEQIGQGRYRNAYHNNCIFDNSGLSCNVGSSYSTISTNNDCVVPVNDHFELNRSKALKINGQACTRITCNNPNVDYLKSCTSVVHTDCFVVNGVENVTGFHRGLSEGGSSNKHYWDSIDNISLSGLKSGKNTVIGYDKTNCSSSPKLVEFEVYVP